MQNKQLTENQKIIELYWNISKLGTRLSPLSCHGGGSYPWPLVSCATGNFLCQERRCIHFKPQMHSLQTSDAFTSNLRLLKRIWWRNAYSRKSYKRSGLQQHQFREIIVSIGQSHTFR